MKKVFTILFLSLSVAFSASAQTYVDDFESNTLGWVEYSGKRGSSIIKDGKLYLETKEENPNFFQASTCYLGIDPNKNFSITANFVNTKIDDEERGIGIILNYMDDYNCDFFYLTKESAFYQRWVDGDKVGLRYAQVKIDKKAKNHQLKIISTYQKLEFVIDNMTALEVRHAPILYTGFGIGVFSLDGHQVAEVESIEIVQ